MTNTEIEVIRAVIAILNVDRDRLGRLRPTHAQSQALGFYARKLGLPHGGSDCADQAMMILQALVDDPFSSSRDAFVDAQWSAQ